MPARRTGAGFTLLELVIAMAIATVLGAVALPSLSGLVARQRLRATAGHLQADIALARQEASRRGMTVHLSFQGGEHWCYALRTGPTVDCQQAAVATGNGVIKVVRSADQPGVRLLRASPMALDARTGASLGIGAAAHLASASDERLQVQVRLAPMGRASVCAAAGVMPGVPACPP